MFESRRKAAGKAAAAGTAGVSSRNDGRSGSGSGSGSASSEGGGALVVTGAFDHKVQYSYRTQP